MCIFVCWDTLFQIWGRHSFSCQEQLSAAAAAYIRICLCMGDEWYLSTAAGNLGGFLIRWCTLWRGLRARKRALADWLRLFYWVFGMSGRVLSLTTNVYMHSWCWCASVMCWTDWRLCYDLWYENGWARTSLLWHRTSVDIYSIGVRGLLKVFVIALVRMETTASEAWWWLLCLRLVCFCFLSLWLISLKLLPRCSDARDWSAERLGLGCFKHRGYPQQYSIIAIFYLLLQS